MRSIGTSLREVREAAKLTQLQLAERVGLKQAHVSAIEVGRRATTTEKLAKWIEVCGAHLVIEPPSAADPLTPLLDAARGLPGEDLELLIRVARVLPLLDPGTREREVRFLEMRAGAEEAPAPSGAKEPPAAGYEAGRKRR